jgi:iron complex outermembrane recepter protein
VLTGGNPQLGPEEADTFTIGFVWQPQFVPNLTVMLDYWDIDLTASISDPSSADIIEGCFSPARNSTFAFNAFCQDVGRSPTTGDLNAGDAVGVRLPLANLGTIETDGIDLSVSYAFGLGDIGLNPNLGRINLSFNGTRVLNFDQQPTPESIKRDCLGFFSVACSRPRHETKFNQRTTWFISDFDFSLNWRHLSSVRVEPLAGQFLPAFSSISAFNYFDLSAAWQPNDNLRIGLTINNLFDNSPPVVGNTIGATAFNSGNTFPQFYDTIGRFFIVGVDWRL